MSNSKPAAAVVGAAAATLLWILLPLFSSDLSELGSDGIAGATATSGVILGAILFYLIPTPGESPDPRFAWTAVGAAAGALTWILVPVYVDKVGELSGEAVAGATTATAAILGALFYYLVPRSRMGTQA